MHLTAFLELALKTLQDAGNSVPAFWSAFSQSAAALALTAVWQGVLVALGLALCLRFAPRSPARHRFALWAAGFGVLVGLQILPLIERFLIHPFFGRLPALSATIAPAAAGAPASHLWLRLNPAWSLVIASLWLAASLFRATDLALHSFRLRKLWKTALPVEIDSASLPRSLGPVSRRAIQICTTGELERPSVIGFFAPRILIPDWLFSRLTPGELDQIVLHETEHLRRRDDWTNLLQKFSLVLFPLNPGLAWIERRLCREREMACDDGVIHITRAPRAYAACLTSLAERGLQRRAGALSLGAWQGRPELVGRVHRILGRKHALSPVAARAVLGALGCVLLAGATALAHCPRLIAFVPAHSASEAQPQAAAPAHAILAVSSHAAPLPAPRSRALAVEEASVRPLAIRPQHDAGRASTLHAAAPEGHPSPIATLATGDGAFHAKPALGSATSENSGFIVMTTWQSLEYGDPTEAKNAETNAKASGDSARVAGPANAFEVQRVSPRLTVTRMYLQIYCAAGARQSAWLVIQL